MTRLQRSTDRAAAPEPRRHTRRVPVVLGAAAVVAALAVAAAVLVRDEAPTSVGTAGPPDAADPGGEARVVGADVWAPLPMPGADEAESYASVDEMADAADMVIVGRLAEVAEGRTWTAPGQEEFAYAYIDVTFEVHDVLKGDPGDMVTLEFVSGTPGSAATRADVDALQSAVGGGDIVLFVRDKGGSEAGLFRLVNYYGLVTETDRKPVDVPLGEVPEALDLDVAAGVTDAGDPVDTRDQWASMDEFVADVRSHLQS